MPTNENPVVLDVALVPAELAGNATPPETTAYIVVDVIRATTTLSVLFDRGCKEVLLAATLDEARRVTASMRTAASLTNDAGLATPEQSAVLLAGELDGLAPPGFDFGNSPAEFITLDLHGRRLVFCTTNGTPALRSCAGGRAVFAGCFRNARAVASAALAALKGIAVAPSGSQPEPAPSGSEAAQPFVLPDRAPAMDTASEHPLVNTEITALTAGAVTIVCAGRAQRVAIDDTVCAGFLIATLQHLIAARGSQSVLREGARIALQLYQHAPSITDILWHTEAGRAVIAVGLESDLALCAAVDTSASVPALSGYDPDSGLPIIRALGSAHN
jgi:2-phosphosulfolactate phosphatase